MKFYVGRYIKRRRFSSISILISLFLCCACEREGVLPNPPTYEGMKAYYFGEATPGLIAEVFVVKERVLGANHVDTMFIKEFVSGWSGQYDSVYLNMPMFIDGKAMELNADSGSHYFNWWFLAESAPKSLSIKVGQNNEELMGTFQYRIPKLLEHSIPKSIGKGGAINVYLKTTDCEQVFVGIRGKQGKWQRRVLSSGSVAVGFSNNDLSDMLRDSITLWVDVSLINRVRNQNGPYHWMQTEMRRYSYPIEYK